MGFSAVYNTDVGIKKKTNQDSLAIKIADTPNGQVVFSLVCDGMGGLAKGEVASKEVITAFCNWFDTQFVEMVDNNSFSEELLRYQWRAEWIYAWYDHFCDPHIQRNVLHSPCWRQPSV